MANSKQTTTAVFIIGALFFLFGFTTWINGPLISYLKIVCQLDGGAEPFYVTSAFYIAYFVTALPMAWVLKKTGMKLGMTYGLITMAVGALLFIPAAQMRSYSLFLLGLFVIGTGLSLLQSASNPYITVVGPIESAAARISIMGMCNKFAGVLAPVVLGFLLLSDAGALQAELDALTGAAQTARLDEIARRVVVPYASMAAVLVALGVLVRWSPLPELEPEQENGSGSARSVFSFPNLVFGVIALFLYVGVEVIAVDTIGVYSESLGVSLDHAKLLPSYTLITMVIAYIVGILCIPKFFSQTKALVVSSMLGIALTIGVIIIPLSSMVVLPGFDLTTFTSTSMQIPVSVLFLALLGLANGLMWPAIWPLAINGIGSAINTGSAMLIMAIAGGAVLPPLYGVLSVMPSIGVQHAYAFMVPCYFFILWYGVKGSKILKW